MPAANEALTWQSFRRQPRTALPLIMAHRGASDDLPENTLGAFRLALEQGAAVLETDLRFTRDDQIVLMHDATVDRTTNGSGPIAGMTLAEVQALKTRRPFAELFGGEAPPTLEQLLAVTSVPLALELKDARFANPVDAQRLVDLLMRHNALARCVLISFHLPLLQAIKALAPSLPIGMITLSNVLPLYPTDFLGPFWPIIMLNPLYVWWARRQGKLVCPLDDVPEPRLAYYRWLGVPVVLSNHPAVTKRALGR
ncbi:MAG: hypothetical protein HZB53_02285 [Chloroflexi bacterium]|nr:hypothetical protein [Chloroflexota bacterium]